ncbi:MAG: putative Ig domain-containing protein [Pseudomonadota bacterium]
MGQGMQKKVQKLRSTLMLAWALLGFALHACSGKVAQVTSSAPALSPVQIVSTSIQGIQVGEVATAISTIGGAMPLKYTISSGALPIGLTLDQSAGTISGSIGNQYANQNYAFTAEVFDSGGNSATRKFSGSVAPGSSEVSFLTSQLASMSAGVSYSFAIQMTGGVKPYSYALTSGKLPIGLTLNPSNGLISGTPALTSGGQNFVIAIKGTDALNQTAMATFQSTVNPNPTGVVQILSTAIPGLAVGAVSTGISTTGGALPLTFTLTSGTLPAGLTLHPSTGILSGSIPITAANSTYGFSITVRDAVGVATSRSFTGRIDPGSSVLTLVSNNIPAVAAGVHCSYKFAVAGGMTPYRFTVPGGSLPPGLALDPDTGTLAGTPDLTSGGTSYSATIKVSDAGGQEKTASFVGNIAANPYGILQVLTTSLPGIAVGPLSYGISTSGGVPPLTFALTSGTLPNGLTLNTSTGMISGTIPVSEGNHNFGFSISVTDATGLSANRSYSGTVDPKDTVLNLVSTEFAPITVGINYNYAVAVTGGVTPYVFSISGGALPSGLSLDPTTGVISGTPPLTSGGEAFSVSITVTDHVSQTQSASFVGNVQYITVSPVQIVSNNVPGIMVGTVSTGISVFGGLAPLTFALAGGTLPTGLALDTSNGSITGTLPLSAGNANYGFSISVTDSTGSTATKSFTGIIDPGTHILAMISTQVPNFTAGIPYNFPVTVVGGSPPYNFTIGAGSLPIGTSMGPSTGLIAGTPSLTSAGAAYSFTIRVTDTLSQVQTLSIVGNVGNNPIPPVKFASSTMTGIAVGPVSTGLPTVGGVMPITFTISSGALPEGLSLNSTTGAITGTIPVSAGNANYGFSLTVTDDTGASDLKAFTGTVDPGDSILTNHSVNLAPFSAGISYSMPLVMTGGTAPYSFSVTSGLLPEGITLNTVSGIISGKPTFAAAGNSYGFTIRVADTGGLSISKTYIGTVQSSSIANMSITTSTIPIPVAGQNYAVGLAVSGGTSPYTFSVSSGSLPGGLTLNSATGGISGTVNKSARISSYLFVIRVTDSNSLTSEQTYTGTVGDYLTTLLPASLPDGAPGGAYSVYLASSGGQAPYTYARTSGNLPSGLALNSSNGSLGGTIAESEAGLTRNFTIKSTDANGVQTSSTYSFTTSSFVVSVTTSSLSPATEGIAYSNASTALAATGGTGPYTFEYTGTLPSGMGLTSTGVFFGTPAVNTGGVSPGTSTSITVRARDALNRISTPVTLALRTVVSSPEVDAFTPDSGVLGSAYSYTVTATGGRAPYAFAVTGGSLPAGLTIADSGTISGIPTTLVSCPAGQFTVRVTDALSQISAASIKCITALNGVLITNGGLPAAIVGPSYSTTMMGSGGTSPFTYSATNLPNSFSLVSATGELKSTGVSAAPGIYTLYITISDSSTPPLKSTRTFQISVINLVTLTGTTLVRGAVGVPYNNGSGVQLAASGGQAPGNSYIYKITSGSLPPGLSMSSDGLISGTPSNLAASYGGGYTFAVTARDTIGNVSSAASFTINITVPPKVVGSVMPAAVVGVPYAYDIKRTGGVNLLTAGANATQLSYAVTGLTSSGLAYGATTGRIYGTPTASGTYTVGITITDQYGFTGTKNLSLTIRATGKTLDLKSAHVSDPCTGSTQCNPGTATIDAITNTSQQFLISQRTDTTPRSLQIAKIDSTGRVPLAGTGIVTINVPLPSRPNAITPLNVRVADMDQDGYKDILYNDTTNKMICVMWNAGSGGLVNVDSYGMPSGFSAGNTDCFPIPTGANSNNYPYTFSVTNNLRPDATNYGKQDIIVTSMNGNNQGTFFMLYNNCAVNGACTASRSTIFRNYAAATGTTSGNTINSLTSSTGLAVGLPVIGANIPANTTITAVNSGCGTTPCITMSQNASSNTSGVGISWPTGNTLTGNSTLNSSTFTTASTAGISVGQSVSGGNFPAGSTVVSIVANTSVTMSSAASASAATSILVFGPNAHTPLVSGSMGLSYIYDIKIGWFIAAKPNLPTVKAQSVNDCPGVVVAGTWNGNNSFSYWYVVRQTWTGSQCAGDFTTHNASDEYLISGSGAYPSWIAVDDFNSDGISDVVTSLSQNMGTSASIRGYINGNTGNSFSGGNSFTTQLQSRGASYLGGDTLLSYCLNGSASCSYPSLVAKCTRGTNASGTQNYGCLSVIPNQCSTPGCSTPFENATPAARIDYPGPNNGYLFPAPLVSTSNLTPNGTITNASTSITAVSSIASIQTGQPLMCIDDACADSFLTFSGDVKNTNTITNISTSITSQLQVGQAIRCMTANCALIPANTFITAVASGTITLNQTMLGTASATNVSITSRKAAVAPVYLTGATITNGSATITGLSSTTNIQIGQPVTCVTANCVALLANNYVVSKTVNSITMNFGAIAAQGSAAIVIPQSVIPPYSYVTNASGSTITINQPAVTGSTLTGVKISVPSVPTRLDVATISTDAGYSFPYFTVFARNGSSTTDPFKAATMLDSFPGAYLQAADIGTMRMGDSNGDGLLDLYTVSPQQSFMGSYVSNSVGVSTGVGVGPAPYYLANPSQNGCPTDAASCFPDPVFNSLGVQQTYPNTYNNQNILDTGDLNQDGIPDAVVSGYWSRGVSTAMGSVYGDFAQPKLYEMGTFATNVTGTATSNSTQITGLVNLGSPALYAGQLVTGTGIGSGTTISSITGSGPYVLNLSSAYTGSSGSITISGLWFKANAPQSIALSDVDQDGILDLIVVGVDKTPGASIGVARQFKGNGDGTFQTPTNIDGVVGSCTDPRSVQAVDIDLDGRPELAVICYTSQQIIVSRRFVSTAYPSGSWITSATNINAAGAGSYGVVMKWGRLSTGSASGVDVALAGLDATRSLRMISGVTISSINNSTGAFTLSAGTYGPYVILFGYPSDIGIADLDSDGRGDVIVPMQRQTGSLLYSGSIWYTCTSTGDGLCQPKSWGMEGILANAVTSGDVDGDGQEDLFISYYLDRLMFRTIARILNISY